MRIAAELRLHSDEQIVAALARALELVDEAAVPVELREAAFGKAVDLLTQKQVQLEQMSAGSLLMPRPGQG